VDLRSTTSSYAFQRKLLESEQQTKISSERQLKKKKEELLRSLHNSVSWIDYNHLVNLLQRTNERKIQQTKQIHARKLFNLGLHHQVHRLSPNKLIYNYSDRILTDVETEVLSHGLKFGLPPNKLNYARFFLPFEELYEQLKDNKIYSDNNDGLNIIRSNLKAMAFKAFYSFNPFRNSLNSDFIQVLKSLSGDKNLIVLKPDKGNGVVLMNRKDYHVKMMSMLNDGSKFQRIDGDWLKIITKNEDKINRLLSKMKSNGDITEQEYNAMYATGTKPGALYGLPKVHKANTPLRPILSAIGTTGYNLAKFLLPLLSHLTVNNYTIKDSFSFVEEITTIPNSEEYIMASFDVTSLFTNIPLQETIGIATQHLYEDDQQQAPIMKRTWFQQLLELSVKDILFTFNEQLFAQVDGVAMGNPLGPTLANIFLCHHECLWLEDCPTEFKPRLYRRYIDDVFLLFRRQDHVHKFLNYLNSKHPNIKFTCETEINQQLSYLDVMICRINNVFETSIFRKKTFTGLGLRYDSFVPKSYKHNLITCLLGRAHRICSSYDAFMTEVNHLRVYFSGNFFPEKVFENLSRKFINDIGQGKITIPTVPKKPVFVKLPFIGKDSYSLRRKLNSLIGRFYPQLSPFIIFQNYRTIGSFFRVKDKLPPLLASSVIYKYSCGQCASTYIGETVKQLKVRICQHRGISFRTSQRLATMMSSSIRDHAVGSDHPIIESNFKILDTCPRSKLKTLESIYIHSHNPSLNDQSTSKPLFILK
jgi:hypothetical protein